MRQTREFKRRRRDLKSTESRKTRASEIREGVTYQTGVENAGYPKEATEQIPLPPVAPHEVPLDSKEYTRIYFDLKTTGLGYKPKNSQNVFGKQECPRQQVLIGYF